MGSVLFVALEDEAIDDDGDDDDRCRRGQRRVLIGKLNDEEDRGSIINKR